MSIDMEKRIFHRYVPEAEGLLGKLRHLGSGSIDTGRLRLDLTKDIWVSEVSSGGDDSTQIYPAVDVSGEPRKFHFVVVDPGTPFVHIVSVIEEALENGATQKLGDFLK